MHHSYIYIVRMYANGMLCVYATMCVSDYLTLLIGMSRNGSNLYLSLQAPNLIKE